jgi:hypothetical protein
LGLQERHLVGSQAGCFLSTCRQSCSCSTRTSSQEKASSSRMQASCLRQRSLFLWHLSWLAWPSQDQLRTQLSWCPWSPWLLLQLSWLLTWDLGPWQGLLWWLPWLLPAPSFCNSFSSLHVPSNRASPASANSIVFLASS